MGLFDFLRKKDINIDNSNNDKIDDILLEQVNTYNDDIDSNDEVDNLDKYSNIDIDKLELFCQKYYIDKNNLSSSLLEIFNNSPEFLDFLCTNFIDSNIIDKISNGILELKDIPYYYIELLQFPIFDDITNKRLESLNKDIVIGSDNYASIEVDEIKERYLPTNSFEQSTSSYFDDINILIDTKEVIPIKINSVLFSDSISILIPVDNSQIIIKDFFDKYLEGEIKLDENTIIIISYDRFVNLSNKEKEILSNCKVVLKEQYDKVNKLSFELGKGFGSLLPNVTFNSDNLIKINHLLYVLENSNLDESRKKYYSYYFRENYKKINNANDWWSYISLEDLVKEFKMEINGLDIAGITDKFNLLEKSEKEKEITSEAFSVDIFINSIKGFDDVSINAILYKMEKLDSSFRNKVLNNKQIKNKFRNSILKDSSNDTWHYFRTILEDLSIEEFFLVFDNSCLKEFLDNNSKGYVLFAALCEKNANKTVEFILENDYLFDEFFKRISNFYSILYNLDFELDKKIIYKMEENELKYSNDIIVKISEKNQYELLKEPFNDDTLVWILHACEKEVLSFFFQNDERAKKLYHKFNVVNLARHGVKFGDDFFQQTDLFEKFKSDSLITFRDNINNIEMYNPSLFLQNKVKSYYEELLQTFDKDSKIFSRYNDILNNPKILFMEMDKNDYILDYNVWRILRKNVIHDYDTNEVSFDKDIDIVYQFLKDETSKKLSEIIIDYLFQDNIYNVWVNIKEMLRYNKGLDDDKKILDSDKIEFYEFILNFDKLDNNEKMMFFEKFKDKNISLMFYEDLREIKDTCYKNMKDDIIKLDEHPDYKDSAMSEEYGTLVYDLRDKEFTMLIKCIGSNFNEEVWVRRNCYSLISNENTSVFFDNGFIYGYDDFDIDHVLHVFESDAFSVDTNDRENNDTGSRFVNRIASSKDIVNSRELTSYSEIQIVNKRNPNDKVFSALKPSYIVVFDKVTKKAVDESKRLGIPVVIIKHKTLDYNNKQALNYDRDMDSYMFDNTYEDKLRKNR